MQKSGLFSNKHLYKYIIQEIIGVYLFKVIMRTSRPNKKSSEVLFFNVTILILNLNSFFENEIAA